MATLKFVRANSDKITGLGHGGLTGAMSFAMLCKPTHSGAFQTFIMTQSGSGAGWGLDSSNQQMYYGGQVRAVAPAITVNDWYVFVLTRVAGTSAPRLHHNKIVAPSWIRSDAASIAAATASTGPINVGYIADIGAFGGDIALLAWWENTTLTDAQVDQLTSNFKTSDWHALAPSSLTEFNTLTPVDLEGRETWTLSAPAPTLTGQDPPGWTFDGLGAPPEPEPTEEGVLKVLTSTGWRSLEGPPGSPGIVETYEQTDEPETSTIGAIWIRQEPL